MKHLLHKLRSHPPQIRLLVAAICALVATGFITAGWVMVPSGKQSSKSETVKTVTPFNAIVDSVGSVIQGSPLSKKKDEAPVQIIDAGQNPEYDLHDETNPYPQP